MNSALSHLIVLLRDEEVVKCLIDRFVVVVLYRAEVRFDQGQLFNLWTNILNHYSTNF